MSEAVLSDRAILTVNAGSSSLKTALFDVADVEQGPLATLTVPRLDQGELVVTSADGEERAPVTGEPLAAVLDMLDRLQLPRPVAVGHRFVHGGPTLDRPTVLTAEVRDELTRLVAWAPLHQPAALADLEIAEHRLPAAVQIGCFDTSFHATLPEVARRLPLPEWTWTAGIRRYGFHGLSYEHVVWTLGGSALHRAVLAHLGNGSSLTAISDGRSVDTTMGFTPDGGVVMGSRSGDLDPGVLLHLLDDGLSADDLRNLVQVNGGLRGLSGGTADMKTLLDRRAKGDRRAGLAVQTYCRRIRMQIGAYAAVLGGLDTLVFTGGIGEHAPQIRDEICGGLEHLGVGGSSATVRVLVVPADEELMIARHCAAILQAER